MYSNRDIRARAWSLSKKHFGKLFLTLLIIIAVPMGIMMINLVPAVMNDETPSIGFMLLIYLIFLVAMPPVSVGCVKMALGVWRTGEINTGDVLYYLTDMRRYGRSLAITLLTALLTVVSGFVPIVGPFISVWIQFRTLLATWLFVSDERLKVMECIKFSFDLMKGNCWRAFCMMFLISLIWVVEVFVIMIPVVAIGAVASTTVMAIFSVLLFLAGYALFIPYYMMSIAGFAGELMPIPNIQGNLPPQGFNNSPEL